MKYKSLHQFIKVASERQLNLSHCLLNGLMGNSMVPSEGIPPTVQNIPQKALADAINRFAIIYGGIESLQTDWVLKKALTELSAMFPNLTHADREFVHNYIHNQCRIEDETSK